VGFFITIILMKFTRIRDNLYNISFKCWREILISYETIVAIKRDYLSDFSKNPERYSTTTARHLWTVDGNKVSEEEWKELLQLLP